MSADYTNLIRVPGITARVVVDADYDWKELGALLADGYDGEQAEMLDALAQGLWKQPKGKTYGGLMQLQYVADHIDRDPGSYDKEAIIWFLRELLIRLEGATVAKEEFNAWLAEHDAKVRAETLREFAHSIPGDVHDPRQVADLARGVADHIEKEAGLK